MSIKSKAAKCINEFTKSYDRFDLADRLTVGIFMLIVALLTYNQATQQMTNAEIVEAKLAFQMLAWLPILFIFWPVIREVVNRSTYAAIRYVRGDAS